MVQNKLIFCTFLTYTVSLNRCLIDSYIYSCDCLYFKFFRDLSCRYQLEGINS